LLCQFVADALDSNARPKFGTETVRRIQQKLQKTFGDQVLQDDSTVLVREGHDTIIYDRC